MVEKQEKKIDLTNPETRRRFMAELELISKDRPHSIRVETVDAIRKLMTPKTRAEYDKHRTFENLMKGVREILEEEHRKNTLKTVPKK